MNFRIEGLRSDMDYFLNWSIISIHVESGGGGWAFGASEKANSLRMPQSQRMPSNSGVAWGEGQKDTRPPPRTVVAPLAEVHATPLPSNYA